MTSSRVGGGLAALLMVVGCTASPPDPANSSTPTCAASTDALGVDHVTVAVRDLTGATAEARAMGFRPKDGRLHPNGIRNVHLKTSAGSLELLTVEAGSTVDAQSSEYLTFLQDGEGGAFLALGGLSVDSVARRLEGLGTDFTIQRGGAWDTLTFPLDSPLRHVYFIDMHDPPPDDPSHMNGASAVSGVALDGGDELGAVLTAVGAGACPDPNQFTVGPTTLSLRAASEPGARGRVRAVEFQVYTLGRPPVELHGITVGWSTSQ